MRFRGQFMLFRRTAQTRTPWKKCMCKTNASNRVLHATATVRTVEHSFLLAVSHSMGAHTEDMRRTNDDSTGNSGGKDVESAVTEPHRGANSDGDGTRSGIDSCWSSGSRRLVWCVGLYGGTKFDFVFCVYVGISSSSSSSSTGFLVWPSLSNKVTARSTIGCQTISSG